MEPEEVKRRKRKAYIIIFGSIALSFLAVFLYLVNIAFKNKEVIEKKQDVSDYLRDIEEQKSIVGGTPPVTAPVVSDEE